MDEKSKSILGIVLGLFLPGFVLAISLFLGRFSILSLFYFVLIMTLIGGLLKNNINIKYYVSTIFLQIFLVLAFFLVILGSCAEHPFMSSSNPGAGTPFFVGAVSSIMAFIGLLIKSIISISRKKNEETIKETQEKLDIHEETEDSQGISKIGMFWIGFSMLFILFLGFGNFFVFFLGFLSNFRFFGSVTSGLLGITIVSLLVYFIFKDNVKMKYFFLGIFTAIGLVIIWAGSCFGVIMIGGESSVILAMIASIVIPILALVFVVRKLSKV
jgi:hypothetical protein